MNFSDLLQFVLTGVTNGAIYGTIGIGFVVIHRITGVINFAIGDLALVGAFAAVVLAEALPLWLAVLGGIAIAALVSMASYWLAIRPLSRHHLLVQLIATLGVAIAVRSLLQILFGSGAYQLPPFVSGPPLSVGGATISRQALWVIALSVIIVGLLILFFDWTLLGKAVTACAVNPFAARVVGINTGLMAALSFALAGAAAGTVTIAQTPMSVVTVLGGLTLSLKGFVAAILGGVDKIGLTLVGGIIVGLIESATAIFAGALYATLAALVMMLVLLIFRPAGLTRLRTATRV
jgi:branched-chain amino acid transport system permease protein